MFKAIQRQRAKIEMKKDSKSGKHALDFNFKSLADAFVDAPLAAFDKK
jgi:hypothetical protein